MARVLDGAELAAYIKERQARQVRALRQAHRIVPRLAIIMTPKAGQVVGAYVRAKQRYAQDILVEVDIIECPQADMVQKIEQLNAMDSVQGVIVQLPLDEPEKTDEIVSTIAPEKDVDGMGDRAAYPSATADAINWLCAGYGVDLPKSTIAIVGHGRLVGAPLARMWRDSGHDVTVVDIDTPDRAALLQRSDVVVSATGVPHSIAGGDIKKGAVVIDAGTASENGVLVGDVAQDVRERGDISITPLRGGVGPLTVALLFDHLIQACMVLTKQRK